MASRGTSISDRCVGSQGGRVVRFALDFVEFIDYPDVLSSCYISTTSSLLSQYFTHEEYPLPAWYIKMPAPFSRLQLAAALIEYDNDDEDPSKPRKNAQDSAIFLPFRNRPIRPPPRPESRNTDYLRVPLPSETASISPRDSVPLDRRSRGSLDALRNPFGRDSTYDGGLEEEEEEDLEVDLASWGLDALVPKDKDKKHSRKKTKSDALPNPYQQQSVPVREAGKPHSRTMSVNMLNGLGEGGAFLDSQSHHSLGPRRHSIGDPLDLPAAHSSEPIVPPRSRSPSVHALIDNLPLSSPLHSVPFPSSETVRSPSPTADGAERPRAQSSLSIVSRAILADDARPTSSASRFDPRSARGRTLSSGSMGNMLASSPLPEEDNPFAVRPPSPSRMSRFDPKAQRARTISHGTMATQMMLDDDATDAGPPRERRYSRLDLMRPKVLIMPSPLQTQVQSSSGPSLVPREGFELSTDGRPLPPGARASRRASATLSVLEPGLNATPVPSNSFIPNPRNSLTLSQLTFRNTLLVDGQPDVAYVDIEGRLKRATQDGEKIEPEPEPEPEPQPQPEISVVQVEETPEHKRPAGKLYGRSLIDDLEARKAEMRGKQRVFRGDDRPSMMARSSTLIAPEELKRPSSQHINSFSSQPNLTRRNSVNAKPLLDFNEEIPGAPRQSLHPGGGLGLSGNTKSVFGVDTLWERELAKLRIIEEQERQAEEERRKREAEEAARALKKKGKKKKGKGKEKEEGEFAGAVSPAPEGSPVVSEDKPPSPSLVLPEIPKTVIRRAPPPPGDDDDGSDDDSDSSDAPAPAPRQQVSGWHSDEEEQGPRRTTGTGPRFPQSGPPRLPQVVPEDDESSEEDVPLVATIGRAVERQTRRRTGGDDESSDEEKPLVALLDKTKRKLSSVSGNSLSPRSPQPGGPGVNTGEDDEDDDKPLGLRVSRIPAFGSTHNEDDDDKPLGLHPEQLRKSQFFMAAQQQQQQQMLAQAQMAQMQHSMMYAAAPSLMGSGFFGPPVPPPMMMYPQLPPTPPPMQDASKFGRVDKWRHDVAVEGER
ncbi:hypothetical protein BN946_scf184908.g94 [Trametes cinnabarina]|uniref:Uncharacterized protein n=1 Tax=Pycnoporus cinnabarinus TaxID=5643 RepID=A0A060SAW3_PYCCI|nr:hypothetical protein BN946_scf184908.g94 [Trametes cinnabarina]